MIAAAAMFTATRRAATAQHLISLYARLTSTHNWKRILIGIGIGALALRLTYLAELLHTPLFAVVIGDARQYDTWAQQIAGGQWIGVEVFYQTPLYPYLLAAIFKLAGHHLLAVRVTQAALGAASCVLLGLAGRRFFDQRVGLIAALLLAIYPPAIFFDGLIQKSSLDLFLTTLILAVLGEFHRRPHWKWLSIAGVAMGAFTLNRENARILYPIVIVWLLIYFRHTPLRSRLAWAAVFTAFILVVLLPVGFRNYHVGGEFLISTSQLGPNLYIGNHPGAQGAYEPLVPNRGDAAHERADATRLAEDAMGRTLSPNQVSDYWVHRSLEYIRSQPWDWLQLMGRKVLLTFSAKEAVDTESIEAYSEYSLILRVLFWISFGLILPLAVFGVWQTRNDWRKLAILCAMLLGIALSVILFYVVARYRYPMVPFVLLFAAVALSAIPTIRVDRPREWLPGVLLAIAVAVPSNLLMRPSNDETLRNIGGELVRMDRAADAIPVLQKAVETTPDYAPLRFNLGVAFNQTGDKEQALDEFAAAIRLRPEYFEAHAAMALTLKETGRIFGALDHFREVVRLKPDLAEARTNLGNALAEADKAQEAIVQYQEALRLEPDNPMTHNGLAVAFQREGKIEEAIQHYDAALKLRPDDAGTHSNLALALNARSNHKAAIEHFNEALRLQPGNAGIHINFADLLIGLGRTSEAITHYEQAAKLVPDSLDAHYRLAEAYVEAGRLSEAIVSLEKFLVIAQTAGRDDEARELVEAIRTYRSRMTTRTP